MESDSTFPFIKGAIVQEFNDALINHFSHDDDACVITMRKYGASLSFFDRIPIIKIIEDVGLVKLLLWGTF